jgi:hypothetical protein
MLLGLITCFLGLLYDTCTHAETHIHTSETQQTWVPRYINIFNVRPQMASLPMKKCGNMTYSRCTVFLSLIY